MVAKKKIVIPIVIVLILAGGGFFWWQKEKIESFLENRKLEKMVALSKDYTLLENSGGKFIVNKKDGFEIKVPTEWNAEIGMDMSGMESEQYVTLYSKDFSYRPPQGCLIEIQITRLKKRHVEYYGKDLVTYPYEGAEEVKEMINSYKEATLEEKENIQERGTKIILVDQKEALRETTALGEDIGKYITVKVPTKNKVYIFKEIQLSKECEEEFNKFLETVSID